MTADELRLAFLEAQKTSDDYLWEIAKKYGIVQFSGGIEFFAPDEWKRVTSEEEQKQATIFDSERRKAWRAYQEALREDEMFVRK